MSTVYPGSEIGVKTKTANHTIERSDAGNLINMNLAVANTVTVPPDSSVSFENDVQIVIAQYGAGQTEIVAGSGVTIRSKDSNLKIASQYSGATLVKIGVDEWYLFGDLTA
jgi:hypothetical protein